MKKLKWIGFIVLLIATISIQAQEKIVDVKSLPNQATQLLKQYFSGIKVLQVTKEKDLFETEYKVILENQTKIDFNSKGEWKEIESKNAKLPENLSNKNIKTYVSRNFPAYHIIKLEKEKTNTKVELNNELELLFDKNGNFIKIDD